MPDAVARRARAADGALGRQGDARRGGRGRDLAPAAHRPRRPRLRRARRRARPARRRSRRSSAAAAAATTRRSSTPRSPTPTRCCGRRTSPTRWERVIDAEPRAGRDDLERGAGVGRPRVRRVRRRQGRLPARALHPGRRARRERPAEALGCSRAEVCGGPRRGLPPRRRPGGGAQRDLGEAGPAERGRAGARAPAPYYTERVLERSGALAPLAALAGLASRATRRLRLPPRRHGRAARAWARACWPPPTPTTR